MDALPGEKSAGAIIFRKTPSGIKYLLLFGDKIGWGFPKGHIDPGETPKETAMREIKEETGITIEKFIPNFEVYTQYKITHDFSKTPPLELPKEKHINKVCVFYLSEVKSKEVTISHEHEKYAWVTYKKAQGLLKFNNDLLKKANRMISNETGDRSIQKRLGNN